MAALGGCGWRKKRAESRMGYRAFAISAVLSLLLSPTMACAQGTDSSRGAELTTGVADSSATIDTVEVIAKREAIRKAVRAFVSNLTRADGENLARWRQPICPSVSGVTREQGEFVRSRILEIAAAADVPFSRDEKCRPNLYMVLSAEPDELWKAWRARNPKMFSKESPRQIERVLATARPVQVWHNVLLVNADGTQGDYRLKDSRILASVAEDTFSVVVVVDPDRTGGATFGQLADFVAIVTLARIDLDADFASSPTILRLFSKTDSQGEGVPKQLTDWDRAFLKALYGTYGPLLRPRGGIATSMANELVP
jgi:hypothetical protein